MKIKNKQKMYKIDPLKIFIAQTAVLTDKLPSKCDAVFIHSVPLQNKPLKKEHILIVSGNYKKGLVKTIVLNPLTKMVCKENSIGDIGYENFRSKLISGGVNEKDIQIIPPSLHTATESMEFLRMAKNKKWGKIVISSQPHHQLRCFLQIIALMKNMNFYPKVYNLTHYAIPWNSNFYRPILGGKIFDGTFSEHLESEYRRIIKYCGSPTEKNKFTKNAEIDEMLTYLTRRDG